MNVWILVEVSGGTRLSTSGLAGIVDPFWPAAAEASSALAGEIPLGYAEAAEGCGKADQPLTELGKRRNGLRTSLKISSSNRTP